MHSGEGEIVPFAEKLYPTGNVEDWLCEVERVMKGSLREILSQALEAYADVSKAVNPKTILFICEIFTQDCLCSTNQTVINKSPVFIANQAFNGNHWLLVARGYPPLSIRLRVERLNQWPLL